MVRGRSRVTLVGRAVVVALAGAMLFGCVEDDTAALFVTGHVKPTDDDCVLESDNPNILRGLLDVANGGSYELFPRYQSQLRTRASEAPPAADPNGIFVEGAEVELSAPDGSLVGFGGLPNPFTVTVSDYVAPGSQTVGSIQIVPPAYVDSLAAAVGDTGQVVATVRPFGQTAGEVQIEGRAFIWPIDLCVGCLVGCVAPDEDPILWCTFGQDLRSYVHDPIACPASP